jgi:CheY-like chemotaxis protein
VRPRILHVDDSLAACVALKKVLSPRGLDVVCAQTAEDALALDLSQTAAAVLDMEIGSDSGVAIAESLHSRWPSLPIAFLTGGATRSELERAAQMGTVFRKEPGLEDVASWALKKAGIAA